MQHAVIPPPFTHNALPVQQWAAHGADLQLPPQRSNGRLAAALSPLLCVGRIEAHAY
jgi:hypothetical protein